MGYIPPPVPGGDEYIFGGAPRAPRQVGSDWIIVLLNTLAMFVCTGALVLGAVLRFR